MTDRVESADAIPLWPTPARELAGLVVSIGACLATGALGGWVTATSVETWYPTLAKPAWTPSGTVISTVWTILFVLMAVAAWRVWRRVGFKDEPGPLTLFAGQLVLNLGWSMVFFGMESPGGALVEIFLLLAAIAPTTRAFARRDTGAALLLVPYLAWVVFAAVLNGAIWVLN